MTSYAVSVPGWLLAIFTLGLLLWILTTFIRLYSGIGAIRAGRQADRGQRRMQQFVSHATKTPPPSQKDHCSDPEDVH